MSTTESKGLTAGQLYDLLQAGFFGGGAKLDPDATIVIRPGAEGEHEAEAAGIKYDGREVYIYGAPEDA